MLNVRSHLVHGLLGGLAAGAVVVVWFFVVDLLSGQPLQTPVLLARTVLEVDPADGGAALTSWPMALAYTGMHFMVFALLGAAMAIVLHVLKVSPRLLLGAAFGLGILSGTYYAVLLVTGSNVLHVLPAAHVLGANLLGGMVYMAWLHRATHEREDFGPEVLRHHRLLTEGLIVGLFGAAAVAVWFLILDSLIRLPFFTPAALGSFLFLGASSPQEVQISFGIVAAYTLVHLIAFGVVGLVLVWSAERLQRAPGMWLIWLLAFIVAEGVFLATAATSGEWVMGSIGWWAVGVGNLAGIAAMAWRVRKTHPALEDRLLRTASVKI
jgi:hypothetical protein